MALKEENSFRYKPRVTDPETILKSILNMDESTHGGQIMWVHKFY